ncbi:hypothetical protein D7Y04_12810 [Corallococcus sp. AB038B]|nr:hypothetical protein D7Y04_12810 [Corallococcus sp. AB038B]
MCESESVHSHLLNSAWKPPCAPNARRLRLDGVLRGAQELGVDESVDTRLAGDDPMVVIEANARSHVERRPNGGMIVFQKRIAMLAG